MSPASWRLRLLFSFCCLPPLASLLPNHSLFALFASVSNHTLDAAVLAVQPPTLLAGACSPCCLHSHFFITCYSSLYEGGLFVTPLP